MLYFPHPLHDNKDGLIAVGGELSSSRLLLAYQYGIFPWYSESPILWWWLHPRCVMRPGEMKVSKSLNKTLKSKRFDITLNHDFGFVIEKCASIRRQHQEGTWIINDMIHAYKAFHELGYAHSIEVWSEGQIVGGLYGVAIGKIFFGESMFYEVRDASKVGLYWLSKLLVEHNFRLIDCQQETEHLISLGAFMMSKDDYWKEIRRNLLHFDSLSSLYQLSK